MPPDREIDLRSDTKTAPTAAMRTAMAAAEVGDEQLGEDPTVAALCERVARLLGKEAAVFVPSGTMCNLIGVAVLCPRGEVTVAHESSHLFRLECGNAAAVGGSLVWPVRGPGGLFALDAVRDIVEFDGGHAAPRVGAISVEQTANLGGGTVWPIEQIEALGAYAAAREIPLLLDGARLLNAVVAAKLSAERMARPFALAWIDLSKGLGCPFGAVLAGSHVLIAAAERWKQRLGGGMRQAGIMAAAGLVALDEYADVLAEDHRNAGILARLLQGAPGIAVDANRVETNIVLIELAPPGDARSFAHACRERGVRLSAVGPRTLRAVTHRDVDGDAVVAAAERIVAAAGAR